MIDVSVPIVQRTMSGPAKLVAATILLLSLVGCGENEANLPRAGRPVQVFFVEASKLTNDVQLSGEIQAEKNVALAFRIDGRVVERPVNVGDRVAAGQLVARLDPQTEQNALSAAKAALAAARGEVNTARNTFERQEQLMGQGFTTRPRFEQALQAQETAQARLEDAEAEVERARDRVGFTELRAGVAGVVTARDVEPGEVVQPGQVVVQLARDDGRDAIFNVPARLLETQTGGAVIRVALAADPSVVAYGQVREVSPQADPVTRTFLVRVGLQDPPEAMRLGSTVTGTMELTSTVIVAIPAGALTQSGRSPAVWIVDPATSTVSLRPVDVLRFDPGRVIISQGLEPDDTIVSGGIQALHPGQKVAPLTTQPEKTVGRRAAKTRFTREFLLLARLTKKGIARSG